MCDIRQTSNWDILNFNVHASRNEKGAVWMIGTYVNYTWRCLDEKLLNLDKFFGYLSFKYKEVKHLIGAIYALE